ncbi:MAG: S8 family serine peptidase [Gemmatimonadota bacterium]
MRLLRLLLPLAFAAATRSYAQTPYVDPALRALLEPSAQQALQQRSDAIAATGVAIRRITAFDVPRVSLFAEIRDAEAIAELNAISARIGSRIGDLLTAEVPLARLARIAASPHFTMLEAARSVSVAHDSSMRVIRADAVRRAAGGSWNGTAGSGVVVGLYDTGLDFTHEDFIDAAGQTRLLGLWDQTDLAGPPPAGFGYGRFCSRADIQQTIVAPATPLCPQTDSNGHGTHVLGTAAGDGSAVGNGGVPFTLAGVAPLADLMVVKGGNGLFSESSIMDGLVFLEAQARALGRPMVVNLSVGSQAGPHDGSRLFEAMVDRLARPGFVMVFSAGNEGFNLNDRNLDGTEPARDPRYFHGSGPSGMSRDFTIEILPYTPLGGACNDFVQINLWYEATDRLDVSVLRPDGGIVNAPFGVLREQDSQAGNVRIDNGSGGVNARNNAFEADIRLNDCGSAAAPMPGIWTLRISPANGASGKPYHFWMWSQSLGAATMARGRQGFDNHYVVSSPGNSRSGIAVGAFTTKGCWTSPAKPEGPVCFVSIEELGDLARFSSGGPTRDGRLKPEITAPGLGIASAKSRNSPVAANRVLGDGVHWINQGTSMAAPHVTGAIALMLEGRPDLTHTEIKDIFSRTAARDRFTARVYDNSPDALPRHWWGNGKLNVCAALGATGRMSGGGTGPVVITPAADTLPVNATTRFFSCSPTGADIAFRSSNPAVASVDAEGTVRALQVGTALVIASSGAFEDSAQVVVTDPATLRIALRDIAPDSITPAARGTQLPLLAAVLRVNGFESIDVTQLTFRLTGQDPAARFILVADGNRSGRIDFGERTIAARTVALDGTPIQIDLALDSVTIAPRDSLNLVAALELSGASPNRASFTAELVPSGTRSTGVRSLAANRIDAITTPLASSAAITTVLTESQTFAFSENPVRSGRVVFNFAQEPRLAAIYTLTGRLVTDLKQRVGTSGSVVWDLTNDHGARVATGAYLVIFDFGSGTVREKLFVLPNAGAP